MGRLAGYVSPATRTRSLKRAINYFKSKGMANKRKIPNLVHEICVPVDIPPSLSPILTISILPSLSLSPNPASAAERLSFARQPSVSIPSSNPDKPTYLTLDHAKQQMMTEKLLLSKPNPAPDLMKCAECEKIFEDIDDMKWHQENQYGKEDCVILQKMMLSNYLCKPVI